ncbi:MAG: metallophosphoesterase [Dinghuibacter sp.]|nr:metallophosphoesterase [Dinghuibacter sp.]
MKRSQFLKTGAALAAGVLAAPELTFADAGKKKPLRFAHITDIHVQPGIIPETGMAKALHHVQQSPYKPSFIINTGDSVMDTLKTDRAATQQQWNLFTGILAKENSLPIHHAIGNHDVWGWFIKENRPESDPLYGKEWVKQALHLPERFYRFDKGNWTFVVLDSTQNNPAGGYIAYIDEVQMNWLKKTLAEIPKEQFICIVSHIPILSVCAGLFFGKNEPNGDLKIQRNLMHTDFFVLKELFKSHANIKCCISGHIHLQDEIEYLGIKYYCNGAISGNWWKGAYQDFAPAYAIMELFPDGSSRRTMVQYG